MPLLLSRLVKFSLCVVVKPSLKNFQNLRRRLARGANNEDSIVTLLVFSVGSCQRDLHGIVSVDDVALFLRRPDNRLRSMEIEMMQAQANATDRSADDCEKLPASRMAQD